MQPTRRSPASGRAWWCRRRGPGWRWTCDAAGLPGRGLLRAGCIAVCELQPDAVDAARVCGARGAVVGGGQATSGAQALWGRETMGGMAHGGLAQSNRLDGEVGYGLPVGRRFVGTPRVGFSTSEYGRDYRAGYGLGLLNQGSLSLELGIDAQRRESPLPGAASNGVLGRAHIGLVDGAPRARWPLRAFNTRAGSTAVACGSPGLPKQSKGHTLGRPFLQPATVSAPRSVSGLISGGICRTWPGFLCHGGDFDICSACLSARVLLFCSRDSRPENRTESRAHGRLKSPGTSGWPSRPCGRRRRSGERSPRQ